MSATVTAQFDAIKMLWTATATSCSGGTFKSRPRKWQFDAEDEAVKKALAHDQESDAIKRGWMGDTGNTPFGPHD